MGGNGDASEPPVLPMKLTDRIRNDGRIPWRWIKGLARRGLELHVPVGGPAKSLFGALYRAHVGVREACAWLLRVAWYEPLFRSQCRAVGPRFRMEQLPYLSGRGAITIGGGVRLSGKPSFTFSNRHRPDPRLVVGDGTFLGHGCALGAADSVEIGKRCLVAAGTIIRDFDGHPVDAARRAGGEPTPSEGIRPIIIGDDVWLGARAMVLKGVTIGDRSVVAAGAVVTADVPPDVVVAGNPARVVKELAPRSEVERLVLTLYPANRGDGASVGQQPLEAVSRGWRGGDVSEE